VAISFIGRVNQGIQKKNIDMLYVMDKLGNIECFEFNFPHTNGNYSHCHDDHI